MMNINCLVLQSLPNVLPTLKFAESHVQTLWLEEVNRLAAAQLSNSKKGFQKLQLTLWLR